MITWPKGEKLLRILRPGLRVERINQHPPLGVVKEVTDKTVTIKLLFEQAPHTISHETLTREWRIRSGDGGPRDWSWGKLNRLPTVPSKPIAPRVYCYPILDMREGRRGCMRLEVPCRYLNSWSEDRKTRAFMMGEAKDWTNPKTAIGWYMSQTGKCSIIVIDDKIYAVMASNGRKSGCTTKYIQVYPIDDIIGEDSREWIMRNVEVAEGVIAGDEECTNAREADVESEKQWWDLRFEKAQERLEERFPFHGSSP